MFLRLLTLERSSHQLGCETYPRSLDRDFLSKKFRQPKKWRAHRALQVSTHMSRYTCTKLNRPSVPLIRLHGCFCLQGPAHRTSRAFRYYKAPRTQLRRAGDGDGEGEEVEGDEYLETMQQRSAVWRELSACVVRPAAVMAMLLLVLHAPHSALSQWPICYDHFVPDKIGPAKKPGPRRATALPPPAAA